MARAQSSTISYDQAKSIVASFGTKAKEFANIILSIVGSNSSTFPKTTDFANNVLNLANHSAQWQNNPGLLTTQSRNARLCYAEFRNSSNSHALNSAVQSLQGLLDNTASAVDRMRSDREVLHNSENQNDGELEHYGRLGMRWGMHIFGKEKTYQRSMDKLSSIDRKITNKGNRAAVQGNVALYYGSKAQTARTYRQANRLQRKATKRWRMANKYARQANRYSRKAKSFVEAMNAEFADKSIDSFRSQDIAIGEKYCVDVLQRARNSSIRVSIVTELPDDRKKGS